MLSWLSCEHYTKSASRQLDQKLGPWERLRFGFHHFICVSCRRFLRQLTAIEHFCSSPESLELLAKNSFAEVDAKLTPEELERLKSAVERNRPGQS